MSEIVERLRAAAAHPRNQHGPHEFLAEAAARIEQLERQLRFWCNAYESHQTEPLIAAYESARAALGETP